MPKTMKKTITTIVLAILLALPAWAQRTGGKPYDKEKLQSVKIAFITQRLDITPEQAKEFWPLFNKYEEEKGSKHHRLREISKTDQDGLTDPKAKELIAERFKIEQELLDIEKAFYQKVGKVISPKQAFSLHEVNRDFVRHLYKINKNRKKDETGSLLRLPLPGAPSALTGLLAVQTSDYQCKEGSSPKRTD